MEKRIKLALVNETFYPHVDGVHILVDQYARLLSEEYDLTVVVSKPKGYGMSKAYYKSLPYKVMFCESSHLIKPRGYRFATLWRSFGFKRRFKEEKFDLIHINSPGMLARFAIKHARKREIPIVFSLHSQYDIDFKKYLPKFLQKIVIKNIAEKLNRCDLLFSFNPKIAEYGRSLGITIPSVMVINGTQYELTTAEMKEKYIIQAEEDYHLKPDDNVLLFVGRMIADKGIFLIADALKLVKQKNLVFKMLYIGTGPEFNKLKNYISELGLNDDVIFAGTILDQEKMKSAYAVAKLFLFPSKYDLDGLVKREAASFGCPSLLCENTFAASDVTHNVNGYVVSDKPEDMAAQICSVLTGDTDYDTIAAKAKETLYLSWADAIKAVKLEYTKLLEQYEEKRKLKK